MANVPASASRARRVPASPARHRAHLLTLSTRGRIPLLVVDPRAGSVVDRHLRSLHRPEAPMLAWSITGDQVLVLVGPSPTSRIARMAHRLRDRLSALDAIELTRPRPPEGLYVHFPFCASKCTYCAFHSVPSRVDVHRFLDTGLSQSNARGGSA